MNIPSQDHKALALLREDPTRFADQGTIVETWRTYRGRRLGPYYRLAWRENGRQRSIYLGRDGPLVEEVRLLLHQAQAVRRIRREHRRSAELFRKNVIRPIRQYVKEMFRLFGNGLYIKGSEIRGIKTAGPRLTAADVPEHLIPKFPLPFPSFLTELHPQPHTNPTRQRGQKTPSPNTAPKPQRAQETHPPRTSPKPARGQKASSSSPLRRHLATQFPRPVDQKQRYLSAIDLSVTPPLSPPQYRHLSEFFRSVDQNPPHTTRGPPIQPNSTAGNAQGSCHRGAQVAKSLSDNIPFRGTS